MKIMLATICIISGLACLIVACKTTERRESRKGISYTVTTSSLFGMPIVKDTSPVKTVWETLTENGVWILTGACVLTALGAAMHFAVTSPAVQHWATPVFILGCVGIAAGLLLIGIAKLWPVAVAAAGIYYLMHRYREKGIRRK